MRRPQNSRPAMHLFTAFQEGVWGLKNGWVQSPQLPASARVSVPVLLMMPLYKENSDLDTKQCPTGAKDKTFWIWSGIGVSRGICVFIFLQVCDCCKYSFRIWHAYLMTCLWHSWHAYLRLRDLQTLRSGSGLWNMSGWYLLMSPKFAEFLKVIISCTFIHLELEVFIFTMIW